MKQFCKKNVLLISHKCHAGSPDKLLVLNQWFKLRPSWDSYVEGFSCEERLEIKQIEIVVINQVSEQLVAKAIEGRHDSQRQVPSPIGGAIHQTTHKREGERERKRKREREREREREIKGEQRMCCLVRVTKCV